MRKLVLLGISSIFLFANITLFEQVDSNLDGVISYREFQKNMIHDYSSSHWNHFLSGKPSFLHYDKNKDGVIDKEEFHSFSIEQNSRRNMNKAGTLYP